MSRQPDSDTYQADTDDDGCADEAVVTAVGDRCDWDDSIILDVFNDAIQSHRTKVCHAAVHVCGYVTELR
jgi:hypothetical protein